MPMNVRIYQPAKAATQSGRGKRAWLIEPALATKRAPEPLMGWTAAGDTLGELTGKLKFTTPEEAVAFAHGRSWTVVDVAAPHLRTMPVSNYMDNFKYTSPVAPASVGIGSPPTKA